MVAHTLYYYPPVRLLNIVSSLTDDDVMICNDVCFSGDSNMLGVYAERQTYS